MHVLLLLDRQWQDGWSLSCEVAIVARTRGYVAFDRDNGSEVARRIELVESGWNIEKHDSVAAVAVPVAVVADIAFVIVGAR